MASPRITVGERRGLIALIIVFIIATVLLCWRDRALSRAAHDAAVQPIDVPTASSAPLSTDTSSTVSKRKKKASTRQRKEPAPMPVRHPRDERVD